jgi:signal transduction histidine kinase/DNA-binding response OmpR family regulator
MKSTELIALPNSKGNILIVDDTPDNLSLLSQILSERGHEARVVPGGNQALQAVQAAPPDLVLLDVLMPGLDGYEVCQRLQADERTRNIPVIFISALGQIEDKVRAFASGGVDYITKPFKADEVLARVETHLALRDMRDSLENQSTQLQLQVAERIQAERTLQRYAQRLKTLHEIDQSILAARSPDTIAVAAISRIRRLIPCQRALVIIVEENGQLETLAVESGGEIGPGLDKAVYQEMFQGKTLRDGRPQGVENLAMLPRQSPMQQALYAAGVHSFVITPLLVHDELIGALSLEATQARFFNPDHVAIATEVSVLLAVAIRQAWLHERSQREIAERKRAQEALRQQALELEARNAELDAFAHTVAHDLKNPLTALLGFSSVLESFFVEMPEETLRSQLQAISRGGRKMVNIINELLLLSSVREVKEVGAQELDMAQLAAEAQGRILYMIEERQAEIVMPPASAWPAALGYGPWVEEVWVNYLSNAVKYGGSPPRVECGATAQKDGFVRFWVRDNGPGLTPEEQERLFTPFERLHQVRAEGHGLGLSIVQRIVEKLGGQVGVESRVGKGSKFYFTLPSA